MNDVLVGIGSSLVAIGPSGSAIASLAYETYGRGSHPAALSMRGCVGYACAKAAGARLL